MPKQSNRDLRPTQETYEAFQEAYEHFNWELFGGELPNCLIVLQRKNRALGYFSPERFNRKDGEQTDEIALNPQYFEARSDIQTLSTLVHEMVHLWQAHYGKPGRGRYHNREWADKMKALGLQPTDTGEIGGRETGDSMTHYIITNGKFEKVATDYLDRGFAIPWREVKREQPPKEPSTVNGPEPPDDKNGKRVKYSCPKCKLNAWAKHGASLMCGVDQEPLEPQPTPPPSA